MPTKMTRRREDHLSARFLRALRQKSDVHAAPASLEPTATLVASYNVHKCVGTDKQFDPQRTVAVINEIGADITALQEAEQRFGDRQALLDLRRLERESGLFAVPVPGTASGHGWRGNVLLVREATVREVHQIRLPGVEPRGALVVDLDLSAGPLRIVAAHFGLLRRSRALQAEAILTAVGTRRERPTLVVGDLNEWRIGGRSALRHFSPHFGPLTAALPSFPSRLPLFALDRILGNPHELIVDIEVHDTPLARVASDHFPIKARIDLAGTAARFPAESERMIA